MLILIGGVSGSGKGLLAKKLKKNVEKDVAIICTDNYDFLFSPKSDPNNFRLTKKLDEEKICKDVRDLQAGKEIKCIECFHPDLRRRVRPNSPNPNYLEITKENQEEEFIVKPGEIIFVEGVHALQSKVLNEMADLKIFCDADLDNLLMWRILRSPWAKRLIGKEPEDPRNYGKDMFEAFEMWKRSKPSVAKYYLPQKKYADLIFLNNTWDEFNANFEKLDQYVELFYKDKQKFKAELAKEREKNQPQPSPKIQEPERERERYREQISIWKKPHLYLSFGFGSLLTGIIFWIYQTYKNKKTTK